MKKKHRQPGSGEHQIPEEYPRTDYLAAAPGLLMCLLTLLMLLMDISMPDMVNDQYTSYPQMFRAVNILIAAAGAAYIITGSVRLKKAGLPVHSIFSCGSPALSMLPAVFFGLFIILILISTAVNGLDAKALHGVSFRNIGIFHLIGFLIFYMWLSGRIRRPLLRRIIAVFYIIAADAVAAAVLADLYIFRIPAFAYKKDISAIFFNGNHYGYFLVMAVLAAAGLFLYSGDIRLRVFGAASMALNLLVLSLNGSTGCLIAVSSGLLFTLLITIKIHPDALKADLSMLALLAAAAAAFLVLGGRSEMIRILVEDISAVVDQSEDAASAGHNRWLLWTETWKYVMERPLLGYGCEGLSDVLMDSLGRANPHNEILSYAAQFGMPAAICYTAGVLSVFAVFFTGNGRLPDDAMCAGILAAFGYFISSFFGVPMFYTLPFFFIFLGLSLAPNGACPFSANDAG